MFLLTLVSAFSLVAAEPQVQHPERRSHCTLAGEDLPLILALADMELFSEERLRVAPGVELEVLDAAEYLRRRHRQGHGGWPEQASSKTLAEAGYASCDRAALDALYSVTLGAIGRHDFNAFDADDAARLLERNGRLLEAERLFLAAIPPGSQPEDAYAWSDYAEFLVRRGKFETALPLIERQKYTGGCGLGRQLFAESQFEWVALCCDGLYGGTCEDTLFEKRLRIVGVDGFAAYLAQRFVDRGSRFPEQDARVAFASTMGTSPRGEQPEYRNSQFEAELDTWSAARRLPAEPPVDWAKPAEVERAIARALELARTDANEAWNLLYTAAETGLPVVEFGLRSLLVDPSVRWTDSDRKMLRDAWSDGVLTRTFGCADPDDPATW